MLYFRVIVIFCFHLRHTKLLVPELNSVFPSGFIRVDISTSLHYRGSAQRYWGIFPIFAIKLTVFAVYNSTIICVTLVAFLPCPTSLRDQ
jgi:hypothetical protein